MTTIQPTDNGLRARLEPILPKGRQFGIFHLSTPPTRSAALYSAPPNERPDRTFCESHFLAVSIQIPTEEGAIAPDEKHKNVLVFGIEVLLYSTIYTTTLFVSKADSTGYMHLLKLPKGTPSPIREVCGAFVSHLVEMRRRKDRQFIVSLFARAQSQYLFPGSVKNSGKHVLDDRGLVKWWCRVLSPLLETPPRGDLPPWSSVRGYLVVPGLEEYETKAFLPRALLDSWSITHPLEKISHYTKEFERVPPRCLIPRYPDDPKSRFRDELDESAARYADTRGKDEPGTWPSVKTLDVFWEMMAFRQECSSGRLTGFLWVVFDDEAKDAEASTTPRKVLGAAAASATSPRAAEKKKRAEKARKKKKMEKKRSRKLRGIIVTRPPRIKTGVKSYLPAHFPSETAYYSWPLGGRGGHIVDEGAYKRIVELLLHLDFATLDKAAGSTRRWVSEAGQGTSWGYDVTGTMSEAAGNGETAAAAAPPQVNNLSGLVKRKRSTTTEGAVQVLDAGLVRKKSKAEVPEEEKVTVLATDLVRKKEKA